MSVLYHIGLTGALLATTAIWYNIILQALLKALGYKAKDGSELTVDESCGTNTEYAINCYQEDRRKDGVELGTKGKNDGACGKKMWADILSRLEF